LLALCTVFLAASPASADKPAKVVIGPGSPRGAVLFKVAPSPVAYELSFFRDKEPGFFSSNFYPIFVERAQTGEGERFVVETLPPGRYELEAVFQQRRWGACLNARTLAFTIKAGKIAYLGTLDPRPTLASIQRSAEAAGDLTASNFQWHLYRTGVRAPTLSDRDAQALAEAKNFVRRNMPRTSAPTELAEAEWGPYVGVSSTGNRDRCI
jgi:hypothetical protein